MKRAGGAGAALFVVVVGSLAGCAQQNAAYDLVKAAVLRTEGQPAAFSYQLDVPAGQTQVVGVVADPYRYSARLLVDGRPSWDEIVDDDLVADHFSSPDTLNAALSAAAGQGTPATPAVPIAAAGPVSPLLGGPRKGIPVASDPAAVTATLRAGDWVADPAGAPDLVGSSDDLQRTASDPFFAAVHALDYTMAAIDAAAGVNRYSPTSLYPAYRQDPFPGPGPGEVRYDLLRRDFPGVGFGGRRVAPSVASFREMAIYVKDGRVVAVREFVNIADRLSDFARIYGLPLPVGLGAEGQVAKAVDYLAELARGSNAAPIVPRRLTVTLVNTGRPQQVSMPPRYVLGRLNLLPYRGRSAAS